MTAKIFDYGRTSPLISDPGNVLAALPLSEDESHSLTLRGAQTDVEKALAAHGSMPVSRDVLGVGVARLIMLIIAGVLAVVGFGVAFSSSRGTIAGLVVGIVCVMLIAAIFFSARRRKLAIQQLSLAWEKGWVQFAPARVGGVWISGQSAHNVEDKRTNEVRYRYRAAVEVPAGNYGPGFRFDSEEFGAPADRDGQPLGLHMAPSELDVLEPEFFNGWTIARWVVGAEEKSATIATDLSRKQVIAALQAAGIHSQL